MNNINNNRSGYQVDPWTITESDFDKDIIPRSESVFTVANGHVGVRGSFSENRNVYNPGAFINGFYEIVPLTYGEWAYGFPTEKQQIVPVPNPVEIGFSINGEPFDPSEGTLLDYRRTLDMRSGIVKRNIGWRSPGGVEIEVTTERLAPFTDAPLLLFRWSLECKQQDVTVEVTSNVDAGFSSKQTNPFDPRVGSHLSTDSLIPLASEWREKEGALAGGVLSICTKNSRKTVACAVLHTLKGNDDYDHEETADSYTLTQSLRLQVSRGQKITLTKYVAYSTNNGEEQDRFPRDEGPVIQDAMAVLKRFAEKDFDRYVTEQKHYLNRFWKSVDIRINGEDELQQGMRFNLFQLLQSAGTDGRTGIPAKGLTGEGYEGHYFWDTEIYILPFFIYSLPEVAKKIVTYRYNTLHRAKKRAAELSHRGALYPWRTINGDECSPYFPAGTAQYHINADILYAVKKYLENTGDTACFSAMAAEMVFETALFYLDLGSFIDGKGFCINDVTGPDEYTAIVNNNTYTNCMVREHFLYAVRTAEELKKNDPARFTELQEHTGVTEDDIRKWREAAEKMHLPYNKKKGIYGQDDSFLSKPVWDFERTPRENYPLLLHYHPLNIYRHQVLKQPDTVLAGFLLPGVFEAAERKRHFDYYDKLTTGDSSLSPCVQSIAAAEIGYTDVAYNYFIKTARMDLDDINKNTKDGLHLASMGGTWVSLIYGFAGLRERNGLPSFSPHLPRQWEGLEFRLRIKGALIGVAINHDEVRYELLEEGSTNYTATIRHLNKTVELTPDNPVSFSMHPELEAVIFDLDGVITDTAEYHYQAWKRLADELDLPFDREFNHNLRGVGRVESLKKILSRTSHSFSEKEIYTLAQRKNGYYRELLENITPADLLPGMEKLLADLREKGIKIAIASASRNAPKVIANLGINDYLDYTADAGSIAVGKPDPEIFLTSAEQLTIPFKNCVGVEDAEAGIEAINNAGMFSVGIGDYLESPDWKLSSTKELTYEALTRQFDRYWDAHSKR